MTRRFFDLAVASAGLVVLAPVLFVIALLVRWTSPGPAIFRAVRVGRGGGTFVLLKFRTMRAGATGAGITSANDPRVTPLGRLLRRWKLDELPQLLNVVRGDMSLVGPRPEDPRYVALYDDEQRRVLSVRPGITSAASLAFRDEELRLPNHDWESVYVHEIMPAKLKIDLDYIGRATLADDVKLILGTIAAVLKA